MTFPPDVRERLEQAPSLPAAVKVVREAYGSHDKLAAALGTNRQAVIAWERGRYPREYATQLKALGVPARFFIRVPRDEVEDRLRRVEAEVQALRDLLRE